MAAKPPIIYIATPFAPAPDDPDPQANVVFARDVCHKVARAGGCPYAPHLLFPQFLDDTKMEDRVLGIDCGLTMLAKADEVWFILPPWRSQLSGGMQAELTAATKLKLRARLIVWPDGFNMRLDVLAASLPGRRST